jgi:hypothetical protein
MTERPIVTWFPDDYELALNMARYAREGGLPAAEERTHEGYGTESLKESAK